MVDKSTVKAGVLMTETQKALQECQSILIELFIRRDELSDQLCEVEGDISRNMVNWRYLMERLAEAKNRG